MIIIPAIDIIEGICVRLTKGNFDKVDRYPNSPLEQALRFEALGVTHLHLIDLDGAKAGNCKNLSVLEKICANTSLKVDFGGGLRTTASIVAARDAGAHRVNLGSALLSDQEQPSRWIEEFGSDFLIAALDVDNGLLKSNGWLSNSNLELIDVIRNLTVAGFQQFAVTDISRDGMLLGPAFDLYATLLEKFPQINLTASGGVSKADDIAQLGTLPLFGTIVGKAIYEGMISMGELKKLLANAN